METLEKIRKFSIQRNREGIILDTMVLLLFFIGKYDYSLIKNFKPTHEYSKNDCELLDRIVRLFKKIIITPQVIAEMSNHSLSYLFSARLQQYLCVVVNFLKNKERTEERHIKFKDWNDKNIGRLCSFGFVDMGMYEVSKQTGMPILTDDENLYNFSKKEIPIIKFSIIKYSDYKFSR